MALVYEARRESLAGVAPRVAIKIILPEHAASETFRELFINEARLGSEMRHQNLVAIQDFDSEGDTYFLVMEYVEGFTLRQVISLCDRYNLKIPSGVIAEVGRQACDGLHFAHQATDQSGSPLDLVHRDIKPSNIILGPHGVVKVLDFGISKGRLRRERKGSVKGTWGYMAPEQAVGAEIGPAADVFGLATVLYELASLDAMFLDREKEEIRRLLRDDHAARMAATLDGSAYGPLIGVLVRALQRDPKARFTTAEGLGRALSSLLPDPITARDEVVRFYRRLDDLDAGRASVVPGLPRHQNDTVASVGSMELGPLRGEAIPGRVGAVVTFVAAATLALAILGGLAVVGLAVVGGAARQAMMEDEALGEPAHVIPGTATAEVPKLKARAIDEPAGPAAEDAPGEQAEPVLDARVERKPPAPVGPMPNGARTVVVVAPAKPAPARAVVTPTDATVASIGEAWADEDLDAPPAFGTLVVDARQPAEVYIAGRFVDQTPARVELLVGTHSVSLVATDGRRRTFDVEIAADKRVKKTWDFDRMEWR